jgi:phosphoribosylamine--glycine ligase
MREVIHPTMQGMAKEGLPYSGFLYAGVMIDDGPDATRPIKVLEFNCRMGDPETQPIMMRIKSDLTETFELALAGKLDEATIEWDRRTAIGVVLAAANYPEEPRTGDAITQFAKDTDECITFHAGTQMKEGTVVTTGGRVLCVTAMADSIRRAQEAAYEAISQTHFDGKQFRTDIGWRALPSSES